LNKKKDGASCVMTVGIHPTLELTYSQTAS